jgi:DNA ligase-associated metallophosphoesterase
MTQNLPIALAGASFLADLHGALYWPEEGALIVADLHLEKGSSFADRKRPQFLPPYDTRITIERLEQLIARHRPVRVICLGDSIHDPDGADRMDPADSDRITLMTASRDWLWIAGNHDPEPPRRWGGTVLSEAALGAIMLRHRAGDVPPGPGDGEISGHFHPTASVSTRAARITGRCFVGDGRRMVLPAFGAYAGGVNVLDPAISGLFGPGFDIVMLGRRRLFAFPGSCLRGRA